MAMQALVEYIKSLQRPGGGHLVHQGSDQGIVAAYPPGLRFIVDFTPPDPIYAYIVYYLGLAGLVPGVFRKTVYQAGAPVFSAIIGQNQIRDGIDFFIITTHNQPFRIELENISTLNQYYEHFILLLVVATSQDLDKVREAMNMYGGITNAALLGQLVGNRGGR